MYCLLWHENAVPENWCWPRHLNAEHCPTLIILATQQALQLPLLYLLLQPLHSRHPLSQKVLLLLAILNETSQ